MAVKYTFSGHESFSCKSLWLKKGYDFVKSNKKFTNPDAVVDLGVGKNMVASIRYWLKAFGIYENDSISWLGDYLFDDVKGKDKFIEDLATLWLLHFCLAFLQEATIYNLVFCRFQRERNQFTREQVQTFIKLKMAEAGKQSLYNENTVKKDIAVLIQNYTLPNKPQSNDDFSSLLLDLDLIRWNSEDKEYHFNVDGKRNVTKEIFLFALLTLKEQDRDNTISYDTIQERIGLIFCMQDSETINMLKELSSEYSEFIAYSDMAGIRQVQFIKDLDKKQVLDNYYETLV